MDRASRKTNRVHLRIIGARWAADAHETLIVPPWAALAELPRVALF